MKIAFVVGFYDRVRTTLNARFPVTTYQDRLIWIDSGNQVLVAFKKRFYEVVKTADGLLVCLGRAGSQRYLEDNMRGIIGVAESQYSAPIDLRVFGNLFDPDPVIAAVEAFDLEIGSTLTRNQIRSRVVEGKILCVSLQGKTTVFSALERAGVSAEILEEMFVEEIIAGGRNSNLMEHLEQRAQSHTCLLYAWDGLRTSTPEVKKAYRYECHEAPSAAQAAEKFKKWVTEGD